MAKKKSASRSPASATKPASPSALPVVDDDPTQPEPADEVDTGSAQPAAEEPGADEPAEGEDDVIEIPLPSATPAPGPLPELAPGESHVVVIGATVAGLAAALQLARRGIAVDIVEDGENDVVGPSYPILWTHNLGYAAANELLGDGVITWSDETPVSFFTADGAKSTTLPNGPKIRTTSRDDLVAALLRAAQSAGASYHKKPAGKVQLRDAEVVVALTPRQDRRAKLLVYAADSVGKPVLDAARLQTPLLRHRPSWSIYNLKNKAKPGAAALVVINGWHKPGNLGCCWTTGSDGVLCLPEPDANPTAAGKLVAAMVAHHLLPAGTAISGQPQRQRYEPAASLEFDQHFGKRCLIIGHAGGFTASLSAESLYVSCKLADVVADVCDLALRAPHPQDVLTQFEHRWRSTLADHLRPPNTDLQFILPVVFTNPQIAAKIALGFVDGENL